MATQRAIGDYILLNKLGAGFQAKVYLGKHIHSGQHVALKLFEKSALGASDRAYESMVREIAAMERVRGHPNVIDILFVDPDASKPRKRKAGSFKACVMVVMELASGGELFSYLALSRFPETVARTYFHQLLGAIAFAQSHNISHRDLKPENLLLDSSFNLKVADWGMATVWDGEAAELVCTRCGSEGYMAPEVMAGRAYTPGKADVWSAGVILFIMLAGFPPFERAARSDWYFERIHQRQYPLFWAAHERSVAFHPEAKQLLTSIFTIDPELRPTLEDVMKHHWMQGPVESAESLHENMQERRKEILASRAGGMEHELASVCVLPEPVVRGEPMPEHPPLYRPVLIAYPIDHTFKGRFPTSLALAADVRAEELLVDLFAGGSLTNLYLRNVGSPHDILANFAGFAERALDAAVTAKTTSGAKLTVSMPSSSGAVRFHIHVFRISATSRQLRGDTPESAAFAVQFQRCDGEQIVYNRVFAEFKRAFTDCLPEPPISTVSTLPVVF